MRKIRLFLTLILYLLTTMLVRAQTEAPLDGPLIALNPAEQDRIMLYDVQNDAYRTLDFGAGWHYVWDFSADGCRVLFTLSDGPLDHAKLYSAKLDGSDLRELVDYTEIPDSDWGVWEPDGSPDGSKIVFTLVRDRPAGGEIVREYHIAWVPETGGEPEFYSVTGREHEPRFSPDGSQVVYMSYQERVAGADVLSTAVPTAEPPPDQTPPPVTMVDEADLWVVGSDGENKFRLTNFSVGSLRSAKWSPDGELISFIYSPSPANDTFWMIGASSGAIPTQLNYQWGLILDTTWLPDSTRIIGSARNLREVNENRLWEIPLVGNADETAELYLRNLNLISADYPRFSEDGRWLAVRTAYELSVVDIASNDIRFLHPMTIGNTPPVWSPQGFETELDCQ